MKMIRFIALLMCFSFLLSTMASCDVVDADPGTIVVPDDFANIQEAINNAADGDMVLVRAGVYYEHVVVNKTVSLVGEAADTTLIDGNGTGHVLHVVSSFVNVTGFTVQHSGNVHMPAREAGICLNRTADCTISGNNIIDNGFAGVSLIDSQRNSITDNNVSRSEWGGIHMMNSSRNTVSGNILDGNGLQQQYGGGINGHVGSNYNNITDNVILNCVYGMFYHASAYNSICRNNISAVREGIWLQETVNHNTVAENNVHNCTIAMHLQGSVNNTLRDNSLTDYVSGFNLTQYAASNRLINNTVTQGHVGIVFDRANQNNITGNRIARNNCSIQLYLSSSNRVFDNEIANSNLSGINIQSGSGNRFYHNNFVNNTIQVDIPPSASVNYWDDGYASGGNHWSDYNGSDCRNGPSQNLAGCDGIGDTPNVFNSNNRDNYPIMKSIPWDSHDVGVTCLGKVGSPGASPMKTVIAECTVVHFSVFVMNYGDDTEFFNITAHVNATLLGAQTEVAIIGKGFAIVNFTWDTDLFEKGNYAISTEATAVPDETDTNDNILICTVAIGMVGDVDNNGIVNMLDVYNIALHFGAIVGQTNYVSNHDVDDNAVINMLDLYVAAIHYGQTGT